ncbi:MAG: hypothetical protein ACKV0T_16215, partial [Planctomycetales bacterium]
GPYGTGHEGSWGANGYPQQSRQWRGPLDVTRTIRTLADNVLAGHRAGESVLLFQAQLLIEF